MLLNYNKIFVILSIEFLSYFGNLRFYLYLFFCTKRDYIKCATVYQARYVWITGICIFCYYINAPCALILIYIIILRIMPRGQFDLCIIFKHSFTYLFTIRCLFIILQPKICYCITYKSYDTKLEVNMNIMHCNNKHVKFFLLEYSIYELSFNLRLFYFSYGTKPTTVLLLYNVGGDIVYWQ